MPDNLIAFNSMNNSPMVGILLLLILLIITVTSVT